MRSLVSSFVRTSGRRTLKTKSRCRKDTEGATLLMPFRGRRCSRGLATRCGKYIERHHAGANLQKRTGFGNRVMSAMGRLMACHHFFVSMTCIFHPIVAFYHERFYCSISTLRFKTST